MADAAGTSQSKRKRKKKNAKTKAASTTATASASSSSSMAETLEETLFWYNGGSDEKSQTLATLKYEVLGPFLFSRTLLCDKAVSIAQSKELLPKDSLMWPMFFEKPLWDKITLMAHVMDAVVGLCEKDDRMYQYLLGGAHKEYNQLARQLRENCPLNQLNSIHDEQILLYFSIIQAQGIDYGLRSADKKNLAASFLRSLTDKVKLVDPVKDRGNSNFKRMNFRAAVADYSTAIKLCPFSPVLYCNRALCYLRNEDYWNGCIDSYRALVLHPKWEKSYYRCAEAWHKLGEISRARDINEHGRLLCSASTELQSQMNHLKASETVSKPSTSVNTADAKDADPRPKTVRKTPAAAAVAKEKMPSKVGEKIKEKVSSKGAATQYTDFEKLQYPEVDPRLSCAELRKLCNQVKLKWCSPASYFSAHSRWEELEPEWVEPTQPTTDPKAEREPMMAKFDEIWCPVLADVEESLSIIPPTFQYFSDGTIMHSAVY